VNATILYTERGVLDNERRLRNENGSPGEVVDRLAALVYGQRPRGKPIGGTAASLRAITIEDATAFAASHYRPKAMTLVVSGPLADTKTLLAPFADIAEPASPPPGPPSGSPKPPVLDAAGVEHVPSSVPTPELWLGWAMPGAYGAHAATLEIIADMASGALVSGAWDRHSDVTSGFCFLDRGREASMLACRAHLSSPENLAAVKSSLLHVIRKGIADRVSERDWRYIYTRNMATEALLDHERLGFRTHEFLLGAHFAKDPGFSLKRVSGIETAESGALMTLYDRTITAETTRAVLADPRTGPELAALPLASQALDIRGAESPDPQRMLAGIEPSDVSERVLGNGLRVLAAQRAGARFQTALLGFFDGAVRVPPAVTDAARWSFRTYIVEPPRGVLHGLRWDEDSTRRIVRGPAGDSRILLNRLAEGLDHYDFEWKSEAYLDFRAGERKRENDPRESTPRAFRKQLFYDHPYGAPVVIADVDSVTVRQIRDWYDAVHRPENALLVLVGPEEPETLFAAAAAELGGWQRSAKREPPVAPRNPLVANGRGGSRLIVGDKPGESQVAIDVGCVLPQSTAETAAVEDVLASLLRERLDADLRQKTGATYGVAVWLERLRGGTSVLHASSAIANEKLSESFRTFHAWFAGSDALLSEDAVKLARFDALHGHLLGTETSVDLASEIFDNARLGFRTVDLALHPKRIANVDLASVERLLVVCRRTSLFSAVGNGVRILAAWPAPG
jgi:predicted Zn-dependent peptidase